MCVCISTESHLRNAMSVSQINSALRVEIHSKSTQIVCPLVSLMKDTPRYGTGLTNDILWYDKQAQACARRDRQSARGGWPPWCSATVR